MSKIVATKLNASHLRVTADLGIAGELSDFFSFRPEGYRWHPAFKCGAWDGYVRLFSPVRPILPAGLRSYLKVFCEERGYGLEEIGFNPPNKFTTEDATDFCQSLDVRDSKGGKIEHHDYQIEAFRLAMVNRRCLLLSPTASGKSLIIYTLIRMLLDSAEAKRVLVVVPTVSLVRQMTSDFADYSRANGWDVTASCHMISAGVDKKVGKPVTVSTWQSIFNMPPEWFKQFDAVIPDEAHTVKAKSLTKIMESLVNAEYRIGTTGTIDDSQINRLVLIGHLGDVHKVTTTRELMDRGTVANLKIVPLRLAYADGDKKRVAGMDYKSEIDFIVSHPKRNSLIARGVSALSGNTLVVFNFKEHGKRIFEELRETLGKLGRKVYYQDGDTPAEERERQRKIVNAERDCAFVVSFGVFQLGVNVPNLHNLVFASPFKGKIRNLQTIGRVIRKSDDGRDALLLDLVDDLGQDRYAMRHAEERMKAYISERFTVQPSSIAVEEWHEHGKVEKSPAAERDNRRRRLGRSGDRSVRRNGSRRRKRGSRVRTVHSRSGSS